MDFRTTPGLRGPKQILQFVYFSPVAASGVIFSGVPKKDDRVSYDLLQREVLRKECTGLQGRIWNIPDQTFNKIGRNSFSNGVALIDHVVSQFLKNPRHSLEVPTVRLFLATPLA